MPDYLASLLIVLGLLCSLSTFVVAARTCRECMARRIFRRRSGISVVGPVLVALAGLVSGARWLLAVSAGLLALEALALGISGAVIRKTGAKPGPR